MNKSNFQTTQIPIQEQSLPSSPETLNLNAPQTTELPKAKRSPESRTNVRFTKEEYSRICRDAFLSGESIPVLLKTTYFRSPFPPPLMPSEDQKVALTELRRIGTNINQIAKHLNSGFREGWNDDFIQIRDSVVAIRRFIAGFCGDH